MMNNCSLMGRLTADPELRHTGNGTPVTSFTLACDRDYTRQGEARQTDFIDINVWGKTAEFACNYFRKGMLVGVQGRLESDKWQDKFQQSRVSYHITADKLHFAERKQDGAPAQAPAAYAAPSYPQAAKPAYKPDIAGPIFDQIEDDDNVPF